MQTEIRPKKQKKSAQKLDKPTSSHYKRYRGMFTVIVSTIIVFLVFNPFFQMKKLTLLAAGVLAAVTPIKAETGNKTNDTDMLNEQASRARTMEATVNTTETSVSAALVPEFDGDGTPPLEYDKLTPVQKKMYDHFMTDKWTFRSMDALKGKELGAELLTFLNKKEAGEGYRFYTKLKMEKRIQDSNKRTQELLGSTD